MKTFVLLLVVLFPHVCEPSTLSRWFQKSPHQSKPLPEDATDELPTNQEGTPPRRTNRRSEPSETKDDKTIDEEKEDDKKTTPGSDVDEESNEDDQKESLNDDAPQPRRRRGFFSRQRQEEKQPEETEVDSDDENEEEEVDDNDEEEEVDSSSSEKPDEPDDKSDTDQETPEAPQPEQNQSQQGNQREIYPRQRPSPQENPFRRGNQPQGVIIVGPRPQGQNYYVPSQDGSPMPNIPNNSAIIEAVSSLVGTASRWWMLTWLARRMRHFEDSIVPTQNFVWERLNDRFDRDTSALNNILRKPPSKMKPIRWRGVIRRFQGRKPPQRRILANLFRRTVVVVPLTTGGESESQLSLDSLPELVSFLIGQQDSHAFGTDKTTAEPLELEIVFVIESGGGSATYFGKAASQVGRLRDHPYITTTVCVDEVAASGGYMIASQADRILAAPFAIVGSIGVIREGFNFYEVAKRYGVQPLVLKAGQNKNPLSDWGPVSRSDIESEQVRLRKTHAAFQELVAKGRPMMSMSTMDGSVFLGEEALNLGLVDEISTSEQYLNERIESGDRVLKLHRPIRRQMRRLSPFDIIPHLKSHVSNFVSKFAKGDKDAAMTTMIQTGAWIGFFRHLLVKYGPHLLKTIR